MVVKGSDYYGYSTYYDIMVSMKEKKYYSLR